ncbi:ATP-binding protein [Nonomuraea wenchangensis]
MSFVLTSLRPAEAVHTPLGDDLAPLRELVRAFAVRAGLERSRADLLVLAVSEAAGNVLEHARAPGTVSLRSDAEGVTVHVADEAGALTADHLRAAPRRPGHGGLGLRIIQRVCDRVRLDHPGGRTRLELFMSHRLSAA